MFGLPRDELVACEWATWANCSAVRELDFHDTFLAADMNHPGDMIPALIAVGLLVATGADKRVEAFLVDASPDWLTDLTTRY